MAENNLSDNASLWTLSYLQFAAILFNGLERLAEIQKSALTVCTSAIKDSAESMKPVIPASMPPLFELAEQAIREFLQIQVRLLDLMLKQTATSRQALQQSGSDFEGEIARLMFDSTDCLLNMQKQALELITHENQAFADEVLLHTSNGSSGSDESLPDTSAIIQAQKKFWDVTLKPFRMMNTAV